MIIEGTAKRKLKAVFYLFAQAYAPDRFLTNLYGGGKMKRIKLHIIRLYEIKEMRGKRECGRQRKQERQGAG